MSPADTINCTETVRCRFAEHLRSGIEQIDLVKYQKIIHGYTPKIESLHNGDGIEFFDHNHRQYGPHLTAAIPSRLAERLTEVALDNKGDEHTACQDYLKKHWVSHGKLCDLTLDEESKMRRDMRVADTYPVADLLHRDARNMPMVYKYWDPINTMVSATKTGMAVIFKDVQNLPLIRVWVNYDLGA
ncbi:hypothetical protein G7054_g7975 [Neopestalotiopsis clavispora]|nr:hypothetical protein G7054_g7975 [Neopestalotiopsis clavispora]